MNEGIIPNDCNSSDVYYQYAAAGEVQTKELQWIPRDGDALSIALPKVGALEHSSGTYVVHEYCWEGTALKEHEHIRIKITVELEDEDGESYKETFKLKESTPGKTCIPIPFDILEQVAGRIGTVDIERYIQLDQNHLGIYTMPINIRAERKIYDQIIYFSE